jgi:hypothetical protein
MKNTSKTLSRKLALHKNTLRQLNGNDLQQAVGGRPPETEESECWPRRCETGRDCV